MSDRPLPMQLLGMWQFPLLEGRRGDVFVKAIVPTLVEQGFGFFDHRGTEERDERKLRAELELAGKLARPVVVLRDPSWPAWAGDAETVVVEFDDPELHGPDLGAAIRRAGVPVCSKWSTT